MQRFMGMMPSAEVKKEQRFKDRDDLTIIVQAGEKGWTVLWADSSSSYKDVEAATDVNWQAALAYLAGRGFVDLTPVEPGAGER